MHLLTVNLNKHSIRRFQIQFCLAFLHSAQLLYTDCGYPRWSVFLTLPNSIFFYFLFNDFYQKSYKKSQDHKKLQLNSDKATADSALADSNGNRSKHRCAYPDEKNIAIADGIPKHAILENNNDCMCSNGEELAESKKFI